MPKAFASSPTLQTVRRLLRLGWPHRRLLLGALGCMLVVAATTGVYAFLMGPALRFVLSGGTEGMGLVAERVPAVGLLTRAQLLSWLPGLVVVVGVLKGLGYLGQFVLTGVFGQRMAADLRRTVFDKLLELSPSQCSTQRTGDLLGRLTADVAAIETAATVTLASWLRDGTQVAVLALVALSLSWRLSLLALVIVPLAVWPATRLAQALMRRTREGQAAFGQLSALFKEGIGAHRTIQAFGARGVELERFGAQACRIEASLTRAGWARAGLPGLMELLAALAIAGVLVWTGTEAGRVAPEVLVSFVGTLVLVHQPLKELGRVSQFALNAATAFERIDALLGLKPTIVEPADASVLPELRREIALCGVSYSFGDRPALRDVTLSIAVGRVTAIVGESGSGKSTLLLLLMGLERPGAGRILLDGIDVAGATAESLRRQFAVVTQEPLLFAATVRENLTMGRPGVSEGELVRAATSAQAHGFIASLPHGYDTLLGERGAPLSLGQRQRLCLARALLSGAPVLVLDEATSSLDQEAQREFQGAFEEAVRGRTAVVVTHQLGLVRGAAWVYLLDGGRVVEQGTHTELMGQRGSYARLWA